MIHRHSGEALRSRRTFAALRETDRLMLIDFLDSLILFPSDDTDSNLNSGNRTGNPQFPENHGRLNLGRCFRSPKKERSETQKDFRVGFAPEANREA